MRQKRPLPADQPGIHVIGQNVHPVSGMREDRTGDAIRESGRQCIRHGLDGSEPDLGQLRKTPASDVEGNFGGIRGFIEMPVSRCP